MERQVNMKNVKTAIQLMFMGNSTLNNLKKQVDLTDEDINFIRFVFNEFKNNPELLDTYLKENSTIKQNFIVNKVDIVDNSIGDIEIKKGEFKLDWEEVTPYKVLGIEEKEYTKEELLGIISKKIKCIKEHGINKEQMKNDIDSVLDAYNELTNECNKKK